MLYNKLYSRQIKNRHKVMRQVNERRRRTIDQQHFVLL